MAKTAKAEEKAGAGRPIEPDSFRQSGSNLYVRCSHEDKARWNKRAKKEGRPLADIVRTLLDEWSK